MSRGLYPVTSEHNANPTWRDLFDNVCVPTASNDEYLLARGKVPDSRAVARLPGMQEVRDAFFLRPSI